MHRRSRRQASRESAFTLIELMVVMVIITLMFGVVFPYVGEKTEINLSAETRAMGGTVRFAAGEAVFRRRPTRLYVDFAANRYWVSIFGEDGFQPMTTPLGKSKRPLDGVYLQELWVDGTVYNKGTAFIQFDPDGGIEESILKLTNDAGDESSLVPDANTGTAEVHQGALDPRIVFPNSDRIRARPPRGGE